MGLERFHVQSVGGVDLVASADAEEFAVEAARCGLRILGIEGFVLQSNEIVPQMHLIADLSGVESAEQAAAEGVAFLRQQVQHPSLFYSFSLDR